MQFVINLDDIGKNKNMQLLLEKLQG